MPKENRKEFLGFIHYSLRKFQEKYSSLFSDDEAMKSFSAASPQRHKQLRGQLAELIRPICLDSFTSEYVAEAMLTWTTQGRSFEEIYELLPEKIK
jgi:hypothetical protein